MFQLKYDDNYINIVRDIPHWTKEEDIPNNVIKYIKSNSDNRIIYEDDTSLYYCTKCLTQLDDDFYCNTCGKQHKKFEVKDYPIDKKHVTITYGNVKRNKFYINYVCKYLVFDINNDGVYIYSLKEHITYHDPFEFKPMKHSQIEIDFSNSFYIEKDGLTNLQSYEYIPFKKSRDNLKEWNKYQEDLEYFYIKEGDDSRDSIINFFDGHCCYLYTDNLKDLKNTFYKYTFLWDAKEYFEELDKISISSLTLYPLLFPQFEFLIKFKLYNLAIYHTPKFTKGKNFKEIFGVEKKYLPFMVEHNISYTKLKVMRELSLYDINDINFISENIMVYDDVLDMIKSWNVNIKKLIDCFKKSNLESYHLWEYNDYYEMAKKLKLDLTDNNVLYPDNITEAHDNLYMQLQLVEDPEMDKKIKQISSIISLNNYEDDTYKIYPANSIADLVDESSQQNNCVRTYCSRIANNECQVYFMRKKEDLNKSFVTIEVRNNKIVQARIKYNELPDDKTNSLLKKWETKLISFNFNT